MSVNNTVNDQSTFNYITIVNPDSCRETVEVSQPLVNVIEVATVGPAGATGVAGPIGSSQPFSNVNSSVWATTSSIQITGSLTVSGSSTFTNIGLAVFTGSVVVNGYSVITSNDTGSFLVSNSFNSFSSSYYTDSGSVSNRLTNLELFSSSLDSTFATDSQLNSATASLSSSISNLNASFHTFSGSYNTGSFTGSFTGDGSQLTGIVSSKWSGSNPITRASDVEITGSLTVTQGITGSLFGTASLAINAATASYINPTFISASAAASGFGSGGSSGITIGTTTITGGTSGRIPFNNSGVYGESGELTFNNVTAYVLSGNTLAIGRGASGLQAPLAARISNLAAAHTLAISGNGIMNCGNIGFWDDNLVTQRDMSLSYLSNLYINNFFTNRAIFTTTTLQLLTLNLSVLNSGTATAKIHIGAGSAFANTAPLKFTSGTNLITPENGAMEYNGTNLFFTRTGAVRENVLTTPTVHTVSPTSPNRTIEVVIDGTTYYISAKTTND